MKRKAAFSVASICILVTFFSCQPEPDDDINIGQIIDGLSALPATPIDPPDNPTSAAKVELGRMLFWDPILSGGQDVACATCHHPDEGYADGIETSIGVGGTGLGQARTGSVSIIRNSPTIVNTAFNGINENRNYNPANAEMFWDNRTRSLEAQAIQPILSAEEMRGNQIAENQIVNVVLGRLRANNEYQQLFENAFGNANAISEINLGKAIAAFERSIVATDSPFDQYMRGDNNAMTGQQLDGLETFLDVGCADCHSGPMLSDFELHNIGVPNNGINDDGNGNNQFRTPTLRNLASTAPYMHNGSMNSLREVLDHYDDQPNGGGLDPDFRDLENLNNNEINEIISFLNALNDESFDRTIPNAVPSGLSPGGNLN